MPKTFLHKERFHAAFNFQMLFFSLFLEIIKNVAKIQQTVIRHLTKTGSASISNQNFFLQFFFSLHHHILSKLIVPLRAKTVLSWCLLFRFVFLKPNFCKQIRQKLNFTSNLCNNMDSCTCIIHPTSEVTPKNSSLRPSWQRWDELSGQECNSFRREKQRQKQNFTSLENRNKSAVQYCTSGGEQACFVLLIFRLTCAMTAWWRHSVTWANQWEYWSGGSWSQKMRRKISTKKAFIFPKVPSLDNSHAPGENPPKNEGQG